jgi:hypothetical protein
MDDVLDIEEPESDHFERSVEDLVQNGYEFDFGDYFKLGQDIMFRETWLFIGFSVVYFLIALVAANIPFGGIVVSPLGAGIYIVSNRIITGRPIEFGDFFKGFTMFLPLLLVNLVSGLLTGLGFVLLIIPGIYLAVSWSMAVPLILFKKMEFWDAMEASRQIVGKKWWSFFGMFLLLILLNIGGLLLLGIGLFVTIPLTSCVLYAAYHRIVGAGEVEFK